MQGKWLVVDADRPARPQVRLRVTGRGPAWDLIAPSTCELLSPTEWSRLVASLGPDPLHADADAEEAWQRVHAWTGPIGAALLDQAVLAGVGNVFRAEVLHACGIHPQQPASTLSRQAFDEIWQTLVTMMRRAVDDNRIITAPEATVDVSETDARMVYKQQACRRCGTAVDTSTIGGRTAYACPVCQPS